MLRSVLILPFIYRFRSIMTRLYSPFVFPEGCQPNIKDPSTFETNDTMIQKDFELMLNDTLMNISMWEEVIIMDKNKKSYLNQEDMMRFGIGEA